MKVYMIGIGGSSMSGLCELLIEKDMSVSGSDLNGCPRLSQLGVVVHKSHKKSNIPIGTQIVVYSSAISQDNEEYRHAAEMGLCMFSRGELLGLISRGYKKCIAIAGSHGKTTTTAMLGEIFGFAGKNATVHLGGEHSRKKCGTGDDIFLCEACEYRDNFLNLVPSVGVVTNMEFDHPDYFKTKSQMTASFRGFAENCRIFLAGKNTCDQLKASGALTCEVCENEVVSPDEIADFSARNLKCDSGLYRFDFYKKSSFVCEISLKILGKFNVENALFACAVASLFGATPFEIQKGISSFFGVFRRLEKLPTPKNSGLEIYCDYAHHPTQIAKISEIFNFEKNATPTLAIFQPHTFSRTVALFDDFITALSAFENLWITQTYPAREKFDFLGSGEYLSANIKNARFVEMCDIAKNLENLETPQNPLNPQNPQNTQNLENPQSPPNLETPEIPQNPQNLENHKTPFGRVLFLGAGDIDVIARNYAKEMCKR
ncbi:MAG: Mur ligase family protein [Bacillota bacterium]